MKYKDKFGKPIPVYEIYEGSNLVTVTADEAAAELYVLGHKSQHFKPHKMVEREYPGHPGLRIKKVSA